LSAADEEKHLNGPDLDKAVAVINQAFAREGMSEGQIPGRPRIYNIQKFPIQQSASARFMDLDAVTLIGNLQMRVVSPLETKTNQAPSTLEVHLFWIPSRRGEQEYELDSETDTEPSAGRLSGVVPFFFNDLPVGQVKTEVIFRYSDGAAKRTIKTIFLDKRVNFASFDGTKDPLEDLPCARAEGVTAITPSTPSVNLTFSNVKPGQWVQTGIQLKRGKSFQVKVSGKLNWPGQTWDFGADGYRIPGNVLGYVASVRVGHGDTIEVSFGSSLTADSDGELQLAIPRCTHCRTNRGDEVTAFGESDGTIQGALSFAVTTMDGIGVPEPCKGSTLDTSSTTSASTTALQSPGVQKRLSQATVPAGASISVRSLGGLSRRGGMAQEAFTGQGEVEDDVIIDGRRMIPRGTPVAITLTMVDGASPPRFTLEFVLSGKSYHVGASGNMTSAGWQFLLQEGLTLQ
jgi:hypothetical protein